MNKILVILLRVDTVGEMAQRLRLLFALAEDSNSVSSTYIKWLTAIYNFNSGDLLSSSGLQRHLPSCTYPHRYTYAQIQLKKITRIRIKQK